MDSTGTVLIVDDEESVAVTLQAVLQREGYGVHTAQTVAEASGLIGELSFDAALLDLRLGKTDTGLDVLAELHQQQPNAMAIMLTGFASLESAVDAIRQGAYDYLIKPCDTQELILAVARAVEHGAIARVLQERMKDIEASNKELRVLAEGMRLRLERTLTDLRQQIQEAAERLDSKAE